MNESLIEKQEQKIEILNRTTITLWQSLRVLNWIGYGFLVFSLFDMIATIVPPDFTNPAWELNFVGNIVERVAAPLIGFGLVFLGGLPHRAKPERLLLKVLSWLTLVVGILYLPLMGLGVSSTLRVDRQNNDRITRQAQQTQVQLKDFKRQLDETTTYEALETLLGRIVGEGRAPDIKTDEEFDDLKETANDFVVRTTQQLPAQVKARRQAQRLALFKNSLKWCLGALLASVLFITIWRSTKEIRKA